MTTRFLGLWTLLLLASTKTLASTLGSLVASRFGQFLEMDQLEEMHNPAYYTDEVHCFVSSCMKYRRDHPQNKFLRIPMPLKETWCRALNRNCPQRPLYICDDHVNIERDCTKTKSGKLRLKRTANLCITTTSYEQASVDQRVSADIIIEEEDTPTTSTSYTEPYFKCDADTQCKVEVKNKSVTAKASTRSIATEANIKIHKVLQKVMPSQPQAADLASSTTTSGTTTPSLFEASMNTSSSSKENVERKDLSGRNYIMKMIQGNPKMYIGVPINYFWIIEFLSKHCNLHKLHIIIALFKIKQNDKIHRMSDHFNLCKSTIQKILKLCYPRLASFLQNFIYLPEPIAIKRNLPPVFKPRYANVQCIIDCFEIEIEKPTDPLTQAQTWSQYKGCNTIKYLIACCPSGFICYISKGFGGRISDKAITERSGFVNVLPPGAVILADRGFKGLDVLLMEKNIKLLRPPSVFSNETPTKKDVIQSKIIASLRIHIERVIRRVREFSFLKPHSVVSHQHIWFLDECVIIACALANLQGDIISQT